MHVQVFYHTVQFGLNEFNALKKGLKRDDCWVNPAGNWADSGSSSAASGTKCHHSTLIWNILALQWGRVNMHCASLFMPMLTTKTCTLPVKTKQSWDLLVWFYSKIASYLKWVSQDTNAPSSYQTSSYQTDLVIWHSRYMKIFTPDCKAPGQWP